MLAAKTEICGDIVEFHEIDGILSGTEEQKKALYFIVNDAWNEPAYTILRHPQYTHEGWRCVRNIIGYDCLFNGEVYGYGITEIDALKECICRIELFDSLCEI